jgi:hypothetical protein
VFNWRYHWPTIFILAIVFLYAASAAYSSPPLSPKTASRSDACYMAQKFVKDQLKAPATAHFASDCQATQAAGTWTVSAYVDAQNGFGALLRNDYSVNMSYSPTTDRWTLVSLSLTAR